MFVGVGNAAVVLFLEIVVGEIGIAASAEPELLDKLLALLVGLQLEKGVALVRSDDIDHVLLEPLLVGVIELLQCLLHLPLGGFIDFFGGWRVAGILCILGKSYRQPDGE